MKKHLTYIIILTTFCIMSYSFGIRHTEKMTETATDAYIALDQCIPLEDIADYYINDSGCICLELKNVCYQTDSINNSAYIDILESLEDATTAFYDRYVDMDTVIGYSGTDTGLMIYTDNGNGYYLDIGKMD